VRSDAGRGARSASAEALVCTLTAAAAFLLDWGSLALSREPGEVASIWPGDAVVMVLMMWFGGRGAGIRFLAGAAGALLAECLWGDPGIVPIGLVIANFAGIAIVYSGVRAMGGVDLRRTAQVIRFLGLAAVAAMVSAMLGGLVLHVLTGAAYYPVWVRWALGDGLGYAILAPPLMILSTPQPKEDSGPLTPVHAGLLMLGYAILAAAVFAQGQYPVLFIIPLGLFLVAYLMEIEGVMIAILITVVVSMALSMIGLGPGNVIHLQGAGRLILVQVFLAAMTFSFLPISAVMSERRRLEAALREAREAAEAASAIKSEFLATISHELRTPLASILGFAGLLHNNAKLGPEERDYAESISVAGGALLTTANDILVFSELEAGRLDIRREPHDLAKVAAEAVKLFHSRAAAKGLSISLTVADALPAAVLIDGGRVRQVLFNLIGNAVKFTDKGAVIVSIDYDQRGPTALVSVRDTGPGVEADQLAQMFDRFSRADPEMRRRHGGSGLGLAICKGLVEAMGGAIGVQSALGQGATVHFNLPAPAASAPSVVEEANG
jgi:signal transduction histidine kinase